MEFTADPVSQAVFIIALLVVVAGVFWLMNRRKSDRMGGPKGPGTGIGGRHGDDERPGRRT